MHYIKDLNLQKEVLPLFDYTLNDYTKQTLFEIFQHPLKNIDEITRRQNILKGFIANANILRNYAYCRQDFHEVYYFIKEDARLPKKKTSLMKLYFSAREKQIFKSKFIQFVLLFHKLHITYIQRIKLVHFPKDYQEDIKWLNDFLNPFQLSMYAALIKENKFGIKHVAALSKVIAQKQQSKTVDTFYNIFLLLEAYISISKCIVKHNFCFPIFSNVQLLVFEEVYHPFIKQAVKNNLTTHQAVVLLTGPNMSGKSTFLKAISLCVYLAHTGLAVPASKLQLPLFEYIFISINHNDDITNGYSHFMNEIIRLKDAVLLASEQKNCFVVFDELFKGTNIDDALQISATTINGLTKFKQSVFFISTHLHQLKTTIQAASKHVDTYYIDCNIQNNIPVFNYQLKEGWSDLKVGQLLFDKEGLNDLLANP